MAPNFILPPFARVYDDKTWRADKIPDLSGKVALVTGANTGLGYQTALELARKNATVFVAARSKEKGDAAVTKIKELTKNDKVHFDRLDLADVLEAHASAENFLKLNTKLDILVNNAGVMHETFQLTPRDKVESHFAISHLGHFVFTDTVLPTIRAAGKGARIVNVTSWGHNHTPKEGIIFDPKRMNRPKGTNWMERYGQSKLANVLFTRGLQKRVGDDIFVNTCHPGIVKSDLGRTALHGTMFGIMCMVLNPIMEQPVEYGALTQLYLATSPEIEAKGVRGEYYFPCARRSMDLMNPKAKDDQLVERLWTYSEELVKEKMAA